eukprot:TRINITY_DN12467_c0_g1_i2.p1 TRINITY_DN12467_c0_g1~~TRINITY_DN12467_c0_g1_i2.p1  ORF type:complete len:310 (+),score=71.54 TRINITY_DN12467_c0_g1_i2:128-1057(+)
MCIRDRDTGAQFLQVKVNFKSRYPSTVVVRDIKFFGHTLNFASWSGKDKFGVPLYDIDGQIANMRERSLSLSMQDRDAAQNAFDWIPSTLQGWAVNILRNVRVDLVNIEAGLAGGDGESPWSGKVRFEIPAIHAIVTNGKDGHAEEYDEGDLLANVKNMELLFGIRKLSDPDLVPPENDPEGIMHAYIKELYHHMWKDDTALNRRGVHALACILGTDGRKDEDKDEVELSWKHALPAKVVSYGHLPEARLMLYAREMWQQVDLTAEVAQVEVFGLAKLSKFGREGPIRIVGIGYVDDCLLYTSPSPRDS